MLREGAAVTVVAGWWVRAAEEAVVAVAVAGLEDSEVWVVALAD